jgi:flagella basal body P-ring formation protein FlgA
MSYRTNSGRFRFICAITAVVVAVVLEAVSNPAAASVPVTIAVPARVEVEGADVCLGDIAAISGATPGQRDRLAQITIGRAPEPGEERLVSRTYVMMKLAAAGVDIAQIQAQMPKRIRVARRSVTITTEYIQNLVSDFIYDQCPWPRDDIRIVDLRVRGDLELPSDAVHTEVLAPDGKRWVGRVHIPVVFRSAGRIFKRIWVAADIQVMADVVVTVRPLPKNRPIRESDVDLMKRDLADMPGDVITRREAAIGKTPRRSLDALTVLRSRLIEEPLMVRRGDVVRVIARTQRLNVATVGEVRTDGCKGDRIRVLNMDTRQSIYARVIDEKTVQVDF